MVEPIRVLIVDDSATIRAALSTALGREPDIRVIGQAPDPYAAREMVVALRPDVMTVDLTMPGLDGLSFLRAVMAHSPLPCVVVSALTARDQALARACMDAGAAAVVGKPDGTSTMTDVTRRLVQAIRAAVGVRAPATGRDAPAAGSTAVETRPGGGPARPAPSVVAIGASTGGTEALCSVLASLPTDVPGLVIAQHMPAGFTRSFSARLDRLSALRVREAADGDRIMPGSVLVAPGDRHLRVASMDGVLVARVVDGPRVCRHRPSVEVLFDSVARAAGPRALGIILTGMGGDGAAGLRSMRDAGAVTIAQDEASCVVFGMPREAIRLGAAAHVLALDRIADAIVGFARAPRRTVA